MLLLDLTLELSTGKIIGFSILLVIIFIVYLTNKNALKNKLEEYKKSYFDSKQAIELIQANKLKDEAELKLKYQSWALEEFEKYKANEITNFTNQIRFQLKQESLHELKKWKFENESKIRQDAISRSYAVNLGKITEHLLPFYPKFPFNSNDARFIGSPIDMIVFEGGSDDLDKIKIWIVEVKTGKSNLTPLQKKIKQAAQEGNIGWWEVNSDLIEDIDISETQAEDVITEIEMPIELWNDSIEISAKAVSNGESIENAKKLALRNIISSIWYINAKKVNQAKAIVLMASFFEILAKKNHNL